MAILLPPTTITAAVANQLSQVFDFGGKTPQIISGLGKFVYGSGGTTVKAWVQTSFDNVTWYDVISLAFLLASASKLGSVIPTLANSPALTDAGLADNTVLGGVLGRYWRVKYTTTGTYAGGTTIEVDLFGSY